MQTETTTTAQKAAPKAVEAYGVKGMNSKQWRKTFKSFDALEKWLEKNDAQCHGTRDAE